MKCIFYNGIIRTMTGTTVQAVAIEEGIISAVGSDDEILALGNSETEKVDLKGQCLLPGFNDSHCHLLLTGMNFVRLDLKGVTSVEGIIARGRRYIEESALPEGQWVIGFGFDQNQFDNPVLPDGSVAEAISSSHPVLLDRICGHVGAANRLALRQVKFTAQTEIQGGILDKDANGNLTGILREAALDCFKSRIPKVGVEETMSIIQATSSYANAFGITSMQTDDLEGVPLETLLEAFARLEKEGKLTIRVFEEVQAARRQVLERFLSKEMRTGWGSNYFKIGNIKLLTDGSLGARTAYLRQDYSDDPGNQGVAIYSQSELDEMVEVAHKADMQIAFHAIGDGAIEQCVNAVEKAMIANSKDLRHRIVHCQIADEELFDRIKKLGMGVDIQPSFTASDMLLVEPRLGKTRGEVSYNWKTMLEKGIPLAGGSDSPVESLDPLWGIYCAVTREDANNNPSGGWLPEQRLTVEQAVALYTRDAAYMSFEEDYKGTVEPGKLADFVILSKDIFSVKPVEILETKVVMTVIGGKICYKA